MPTIRLLISSFALRGHAPHQATAIGFAERSVFGLPNGRFRHPPDQCLKTRCLPATRSGPVARNGLSLSRAGCSLSEPPSRCRSSWPATSLPPARSSLPVRAQAPQPDSGLLPVYGCFHAWTPLQLLAHGIGSCSAGPASPPGFLPPSGLSAKPAWRPPGPPSEHARSPFAPRCCSVSSVSNGSPFQVRYASVGSLFPG